MDIECDCVATVERCEENLSEIGWIVEDHKAYLVGTPFITIHHIFCETNGLAHMITHLTSSPFKTFSWLEETAAIIQDILFIKRCNSS